MYYKEIEIRWSDMDANRHLANTAYLDFGGHTRIDFLASLGFDQKYMATKLIVLQSKAFAVLVLFEY